MRRGGHLCCDGMTDAAECDSVKLLDNTAHQGFFMRKLAYLALLSALMAGSSAQAMTYGLIPFQNGSTAILAQGRITQDESARFLLAMHEAQQRGAMPRTLIISLPGGVVESALELGQTLRQLGMRTVVGSIAQASDGQRALTAGGCHSACVMVFMAGVNRSVLPGSRVGVHSPQIVLVAGGRGYKLDETTNRYIVQRSAPVLRSYARAMGVSPSVIDVANSVPHTSIRTFSSSELSRYHLVTSGSSERVARASGKRAAATRQKRRAS